MIPFLLDVIYDSEQMGIVKFCLPIVTLTYLCNEKETCIYKLNSSLYLSGIYWLI